MTVIPHFTHKICTRCKCTKEYDQFSRDQRYVDGFNSWCKSCHSSYTAEYIAENGRGGGTASYPKNGLRPFNKLMVENILSLRKVTFNDAYQKQAWTNACLDTRNVPFMERLTDAVDALIEEIRERLKAKKAK